MKHYLIPIFLVILSVGLAQEAYAGTLQPDNYPSVPDAFVNYNSTSNESTITWDFSTLPDYTDGTLNGQPAKCAIKADFGFSNDPTDDPGLKITSFLPRFYTPTYDPSGHNTAGVLQSSDTSDTDVQGEEIPCTGELILDFDGIIGPSVNTGLPGHDQTGHANNTATYVAVEPFISFYIMTSNGLFQTDDSTVVDEVFIMYHPQVAEIDQSVINWACGANDSEPENQIAVGNVLFIDQTGIRGTAGPNNCDTVLELQSGEYCCNFIIIYTNNSDCSDCVPPTLGINKRGQSMVDNGFSFNGNYINVQYFHTPFPLISTDVGVNNTMTFKIYENHGIKDITNARVGLGMESKSTPIDKAEVLLDILFLKGLVKDIEIKDDSFLIQNVTASSNVTKCKESSNQEDCLEVTLVYFYRESPMYNIVAVSPNDDNHNDWTVYFNDGIKVNGESLNPAKTALIAGNFYTQLDKWQDSWTDKNGIEYERNSNSGVMIRTTAGTDYECNDIPLDQINGGYGRENCHFRAMTNLWD